MVDVDVGVQGHTRYQVQHGAIKAFFLLPFDVCVWVIKNHTPSLLISPHVK